MPTTTPVEHWRIPTLPDPADGPDAFQKVALDIEASLTGDNVTNYTPGWGAVGDVQPNSPGSILGRFRLQQRWCDVYLYVTFTASTGGGSGALYFLLPVASMAGSQQMLNTYLYIPSVGVYHGFGRVDANSNIMYPHFPGSSATSICYPWTCTNATHAAGTGSPLVPASYNVKAGGYIVVQGTYLVS